MIAISAKPTRTMPDGRREVRAIIISDAVPSPLPTDGSQVDGLSEDTVFAPFSLLYVVNDVSTKVFVANESGVFVAQKSTGVSVVGNISLENVSILVADFSDSETLSVLLGAYYGTKRAVVS